jgi:hypothetical protein
LSASTDFSGQVDQVLEALSLAGYLIDQASESLRTADFCTLVVYQQEVPSVKLKLDFVNDLALHFGGLFSSSLFPRVDSPRNILSNKLTALFRFEAKDLVDIHSLCTLGTFKWPEIMGEARQKEAGLEAPVAAEIINGLPHQDFLAIRWIKQPDWQIFQADLHRITLEMLAGVENSLGPPESSLDSLTGDAM